MCRRAAQAGDSQTFTSFQRLRRRHKGIFSRCHQRWSPCYRGDAVMAAPMEYAGKKFGGVMLGTGLAGLVICQRNEDLEAQQSVNSVECRLQTLMAPPAANAPEHGVEALKPVLPASPYPASALKGLPIPFSSRELEIVARIAAGATSFEIAERLHISVYTVKNHRKNILRKADCRNSGQLINRCIALGLV
ncbi:helix-turn-helix transcriptional regulator [Microbulbifer pacificus]|uniref:Helix-turn-helix transcriptional regulator n=1 Tax=Microbulbifer pacificus TaxID=407164 RepID=A0AAU0N360_9GAMM|nr:helix-turn-helix transcriptional regulator [Microbulbifer pacificus]WOX06932.1 helix-turn-helix transcriptional regulator [Microbulbifer pacificus]